MKILNKFGELCGWAGIVLIQASTLPATIGKIMNPAAAMPPLSMVLLVVAGLFLFLIRAVIGKDTLYIVSNSIGLFFQVILMALIIFPM